MTNTAILPSGDDLQVHAVNFFRDAETWLRGHWLDILIAAGIAVAVVVVLHLIRHWALKLCRQGEGAANWYSIIGRAIARTGNFFIVMAAVRLVVGYADAPLAVHATVKFLFTIAAVFQAAIWVREIVFGVVENRTLAEGESSVALSSALGIIRLLVSIALFAIALVVVLSNVGVNVTGLVAGLGVGGIAIGLAAQGIFADLFAALAILFDRPFRVGDTITYDGAPSAGVIERIGLKSTRLRGSAGEERIIANKKLLDSEILNTTRRIRNRFKFAFTLDYHTPTETIVALPELLRDAVESEGYTHIHGGVTAFADNGLTYDVEFESKEPDFPPDARDRVAAAILARFRAQGIALGFPSQIALTRDDARVDQPASGKG